MVLDNLQVKHKVFGLGTVIASDGKYMTIKFGDTIKSFVYPDSFEKFLTLADGSINDEIIDDLAKSTAEKKRILDKKVAENLHSMKHGIVIPGKETTPDQEDEDNHYKSSEGEDV